MSKYLLDNLFGSKARVKILKFLFRNYPADFNLSEVSKRAQESIKDVKKEIKLLIDLGLVKRK